MDYVAGSQRCTGLRTLEIRGWDGRVGLEASDDVGNNLYVEIRVPRTSDGYSFGFGREVDAEGRLTYGTSLRAEDDDTPPMFIYLPEAMMDSVTIVRVNEG